MEGVLDLKALVEYQEGSIVSRALMQKESGSLTLFALSKGESINEHISPYRAFLLVVEGECGAKIGDEMHSLKEGQCIFMPENVPHALYAEGDTKFLLFMLK